MKRRNDTPWTITHLPDNGGGPRAIVRHKQSKVSQMVAASCVSERDWNHTVFAVCLMLGVWDAFAS